MLLDCIEVVRGLQIERSEWALALIVVVSRAAAMIHIKGRQGRSRPCAGASSAEGGIEKTVLDLIIPVGVKSC